MPYKLLSIQTINPVKQRGAALIVSLLILSIVVVIVATMTVEHNFHIRRVSNQLTASQAYSYLRATEAVAHKALQYDLEQDRDNGESADYFDELWAQEAPPFTVDNGAYTGKLYDLQARFNINSLAATLNDTPQNPKAIPYSPEQGIFIRLLQSFNDDEFTISYDQAVSITESLIDYIDADQTARGFDCGEDDAYYGIEGRRPHRTADQPLASVSELRLICNIPVELFRRLEPHVTVWPLSGKSAININTASVEVLRSVIVDEADVDDLKVLSPGFSVPAPLDIAQLEDFLERQRTGYTSFSTVANDLVDAALWPSANLSLASDYFLLSSDAKLGDVVMHLDSVFSRKAGTISILARSTDGL